MVLKGRTLVFSILTKKIPFSLVGIKESGSSRHHYSQSRLVTMQIVWELIALELTFLNSLITLNNLANPELCRQIVAYLEVLERLILANHNDDE